MGEPALKRQLEPLTAEAFAPFGRVIDWSDLRGTGVEPETINEGHTRKFADLLPFDCAHEGGRLALHFYRSEARTLPLEIRCLERHPLGSQAFIPLQQKPYVVVVAPPGREPEPTEVRAFLARGTQAVQYDRGTWHHYQISLEADCEYLVLDREGPGDNCDEFTLSRPLLVDL